MMSYSWLTIYLCFYFFAPINLFAQELFQCKNKKSGEIVWRNKKCESNEIFASQESLKDITSHTNKGINKYKDGGIQKDHEYENMIEKYEELKKSRDVLIIEMQEIRADFIHNDLDNVNRTLNTVRTWVDPRVAIYNRKLNDKMQKLSKIENEMNYIYTKITKKRYESGKIKLRQTLPFEQGNLGNCGGDC